MIKIVGLLLVAAFATYGLHAFAQMRADVRPSMTPIGSSSSNGVSFAWFYDSTERTVVVCRVGQAPGDSVIARRRRHYSSVVHAYLSRWCRRHRWLFRWTIARGR